MQLSTNTGHFGKEANRIVKPMITLDNSEDLKKLLLVYL